MFGARIKIMWEEQIVDPPIEYVKRPLRRQKNIFGSRIRQIFIVLRIDLQALTLAGPIVTRPVLDPLAALSFDNRLSIRQACFESPCPSLLPLFHTIQIHKRLISSNVIKNMLKIKVPPSAPSGTAG